MAKSTIVNYDDSQLQQMFAELTEKERARALRSAVLKGGNAVKRAAVGVLRSKIHSSTSLERGVKVLAFKQKVGFRVTIGTPKGSRKPKRTTTTTDIKTGKKRTSKPAEDRSYILRIFEASSETERKHKSGKSSGILKQIKFMEAGRDMANGQVNEEIQREFRLNIQRIAQKHGCK